MTDLSILIITNGAPHAGPYLAKAGKLSRSLGAEYVIAGDGRQGMAAAKRYADVAVQMYSAGYMESIYHASVQKCSGDYILRLDDDEEASPALIAWLSEHRYKDAPLWAFPRCKTWGGVDTFITNHPLWPDLQTRCGVKSQMGGRYNIHDGATHGTGRVAPVAILHHKFVIKSLEERKRIAANYDAVKSGCGTGATYGYYNLPEMCYTKISIALVGSGSFGGELEPGLSYEVTL